MDEGRIEQKSSRQQEGRVERKPDEPSYGPIIACIGPKSSLSEKEERHLRRGAEFVAGAKEDTFTISNISQRNKWSEGYHNCTGVAITGVNKEGKNLSFLSHQGVGTLLAPQQSSFVEELGKTTQMFSDRLRKDNPDISAVIFGGNYFNDEVSYREYVQGNKEYKEGMKTAGDDYGEAIKILGEAIKKSLDLEPRVVIGPNTVSGQDVKVILDTLHRRLYMLRPVQPGIGTHMSFLPSEVDKYAEIWKKDHA